MLDHNTGYIQSLAEEYVTLVDAMRQGQYADDSEWRMLSSQRSLIHDELIRLTGLSDRKAMYAHCRELLAMNRADSEGKERTSP